MRTAKMHLLPQQERLAELVLDCFRQACSERRLDVAEHLLTAVEQISVEDERAGHPDARANLDEAYGVLLDVMRPSAELSRDRAAG